MNVLPSVKAHGGTTAQLATNQESLFVVYSGTTTRKSSLTESDVSLREHRQRSTSNESSRRPSSTSYGHSGSSTAYDKVNWFHSGKSTSSMPPQRGWRTRSTT